MQLNETPEKVRYLKRSSGEQARGETLHPCVRRHCEEEECRVEVGRLLHAAGVFKSLVDGVCHQPEHLSECSTPGAYEAATGPHSDKLQIDTIWIDRPTSADRFKPAYEAALTGNNAPVYLRRFDG